MLTATLEAMQTYFSALQNWEGTKNSIFTAKNNEICKMCTEEGKTAEI
jgi:hypothetical protein